MKTSVASARGRKWEEKSDRVETFTSGSDTQICIYDKAQELLAKQDAEKTAAVSSMFPNGYFHLTRVEYRLRRKALKMAEIHSLQDLKEKEDDLIAYLTTRWFRILNCRPSKGNETRYKAHPVWKLVTYAFKTVFDEQNNVDDGDKKPLERRDPNIVRCEPEELKSQAVGVLASYIAQKFGYQKDIQKVWRLLLDWLELNLPQIFKKANYRARKTELEKGVYVESSDSLAELANASGGFGFDDCGPEFVQSDRMNLRVLPALMKAVSVLVDSAKLGEAAALAYDKKSVQKQLRELPPAVDPDDEEDEEPKRRPTKKSTKKTTKKRK